jgi:hypothetical protein
MAILSAIPKCFEFLVYREMYNDLKNLMSINQHGFMKFGVSFVLNSIEDGNQVESIYYTDFSKAFDRVRQQLLLNKMSVGIETARCMWLESYLSGRNHKIRICDAVSKDIKMTSDGLSTEYRRFSIRYVYSSTPIT